MGESKRRQQAGTYRPEIFGPLSPAKERILRALEHAILPKPRNSGSSAWHGLHNDGLILNVRRDKKTGETLTEYEAEAKYGWDGMWKATDNLDEGACYCLAEAGIKWLAAHPPGWRKRLVKSTVVSR
jgi:hypothetical protein